MAKKGATLFELLVVLGIIGFIISITLFNFEEFVERVSVDLNAKQVVEALKHAQFLSLTRQQSHEVVGAGSQLWIKSKGDHPENIVWNSFPRGFTIDANRWPSFSSFGFARAGTIIMESQHYAVQIKVSTLGSIRLTEIQHK
ncbi:MAG: type II secretion system protein [SAR324 cluster bacterium]|nr:type II secretion system protein [SAR324 cluster bacterium]